MDLGFLQLAALHLAFWLRSYVSAYMAYVFQKPNAARLKFKVSSR